jgi:hypothetical protein
MALSRGLSLLDLRLNRVLTRLSSVYAGETETIAPRFPCFNRTEEQMVLSRRP